MIFDRPCTQVDFYGYTALHAAGENGRTEMVGPLLDAGANIDRADVRT